MKLFEIRFPSLLFLWEYRLLVNSRILKTFFFRKTLLCNCTEAEIELAIVAYRAKVKAVYAG